jgi:endonuclease/exonuclease/phosphatase family metal-dependent hydrolase
VVLAFLLAVIVGTWNGKWFPSGRAEHRASPEAEARTVREAGRLLREGIDALDPAGTEDVVLCLNEIRGRKAAAALCEAIGRPGLSVAVVSGYRRRDRFDMQQDVIATTLPVATSRWGRWKKGAARDGTPPRGYAYAELVFPSAVTVGVYGVHLKSNYRQTPQERRINRDKRTAAVAQLISLEKRSRRPVVVAGDFNADAWDGAFSDETVFADLASAGFSNALARLSAPERTTFPGRNGDEGAALDYVFVRDLEMDRPVVRPSGDVSDHSAVFVRVAPKGKKGKKGKRRVQK